MTNQISLLEYLQQAPPAIPIICHGEPESSNTQNLRYGYSDIQNLSQWHGFSLSEILNHYHALLNAPHLIGRDPYPSSPPDSISSAEELRPRVIQYVQNRVRRSLRAGFQQLRTTQALGSRTEMTYDHGDMARLIDNSKPDTAYFNPVIPNTEDRPNRAPGDVKSSLKWSTTDRDQGGLRRRREYRQALAQVNFYMKQHQTQYGYILTDKELVAIRRLDFNGNLELSAPVPWAQGGTVTTPRLTILLALWYLGMLASEDGGQYGWARALN